MTKCVDKQKGMQLHAYEMGWLSTEEANAFEVHCLKCRSCFEKLDAFSEAAGILTSDEEIASLSDHAVQKARVRTPLSSKMLDLFWPRKNILLRPAFAYAAILLLLPLAYKGLENENSSQDQIVSIQTVELVARRQFLIRIKPLPNEDIMLRFGFGPASPGKTYAVVLTSATSQILYQNKFFVFNEEQVGQLRVPSQLLEAGDYMLVIQDPNDSSILGTDTLRFQVGE